MKSTPQKDFPDGFPISEKKARAQIGVTRDEMRALRNTHLIEGTHYARGKQQSVWLNQAGLAVLLATLGPSETLTRNRAVGGNPHVLHPVKAALLNLLRTRAEQLQKTPPPERRLRVVNGNLQFKHMLIACALEEDCHRPQHPLRVRVNSNLNFMRGMEIPVRLVPGYTDLYELTRKCPRAKGKW
jgi:hypothetical protein